MGNILTVAQHHREIWSRVLERPELRRILDDDPVPPSPTVEEEYFIRLLIIHIDAAFRCIALGGVPKVPNYQEDLASLLGKPLPRVVWEQVKKYQDERLVRTVDAVIGAAG